MTDPIRLPSFIVPRPPVPKARPRHGGGNTYTPKATKDAQVIVATYARKAWGPRTPTLGPVRLDLEFHLATRGRADGDNLEKLVWDALEGYLYVNDRQIVRWSGAIILGAAEPHTRITAEYREDPIT